MNKNIIKETFIGQDDFTIQRIKKRISEDGYYRMGNYDLALQYFEILKQDFPKLQLVTGIGEHCVSDYFYLPSYRKNLLDRIAYDINEYEIRISMLNKAKSDIENKIE